MVSASVVGRCFSRIFGIDEPLFGFTELPLEMPNPSLQRANVALGREVQEARDALHALVERPFNTAAEPKTFHHQPLNPGVLHQLCDPRVLQKTEKAVFELGHGRGVG